MRTTDSEPAADLAGKATDANGATTDVTQTDVLIVGAGPTGLALAATLAQQSVSAVVIDQAPRGANTSRAAVIHARTMDVLDPLGLAGPLLDEGLIVPQFSVRHVDRVLLTIDFTGIKSPHPYAVMLPQSTTERIIADALPDDLPVLREHSIHSLGQSDDGVDAVVSRPDGTLGHLRARWLVGCDGAHSRVRELAGIGFNGGRYPQSFLLADVRMDWPVPRTEVELFLSPEGLVVVAPLPDDRFRIVATIDPSGTAGTSPDRTGRTSPDGTDFTGSAEVCRPAVQELLRRRGPAHLPAQVHEVLWSSRFVVQHRLADRYRCGHVFLAGDAAHVHSPAGGQGMNIGIQDATDLGTMLADEADGMPVDLDGYQARRRPQAERVVRLTDRMTTAAITNQRAAAAVRDLVIAIAGHIPAMSRGLAAQLSGVALRRR